MINDLGWFFNSSFYDLWFYPDWETNHQFICFYFSILHISRNFYFEHDKFIFKFLSDWIGLNSLSEKRLKKCFKNLMKRTHKNLGYFFKNCNTIIEIHAMLLDCNIQNWIPWIGITILLFYTHKHDSSIFIFIFNIVDDKLFKFYHWIESDWIERIIERKHANKFWSWLFEISGEHSNLM